MFSSKKKSKVKESQSDKIIFKNHSKSFSNQFKSPIKIDNICRKKNSDSDSVSHVTSVDSNTDASVASSLLIEPVVADLTITNISNERNGGCEISDDELLYPNWYKQTLSLPACCPYKLDTPISLKISRTSKGDFGFVLRKGYYVQRSINELGNFSEIKHQTIFSEPVQMNRESLLVPGDLLIEVNGVNVQEMSRDEIIGIVKSCGSDVILTIEPSSECLEFSFRRCTNLSSNYINVRTWIYEKKSFEGSYSDVYNKVVNNFETLKCIPISSKFNSVESLISKEYSKSEKVWINFNEGFAGGYIIRKMSDNKCLIKLTNNGSEIEVSDEDIHLANSSVYDLEENLSLLPHLNESSVLHNIRLRFCTNLIHTYVGKNILYINPMNNLNCFSEKVMHLFKFAKAEDLPPHVYSVAQNTFENLRLTKENQSICMVGRSGSGKSTVLTNLVNYLTYTTTLCSNKANVTNEKIQALWVLLDAFTCTKTGITTNASRCGKIISLHYSSLNHNLVLTGLNLQLFLLDRNRLIRRPDGEPTFHIFYNFLASLSPKQIQSYNLQFINEPNTFMRPLQRDSEIELAKEKWNIIRQAALILGITEIEWDVICRLLAAIFHLGSAKTTTFKQNNQKSGRFLNKEAAKRAANTLNCSEEALNRAVFEYFKDDLSDNESEASETSSLKFNAADLLNGFVIGIYLEVIEMIIFFINRSFSANHYRVMHSITLFDPPGFQVTSNLNKKQVGSYEDLLYNYAYERLLDLNVKQNILRQTNLYNKENINTDFLGDLPEVHNVLSLLDGNCKSEKFDTIGKQGLLNFVESEAIAGSEATLIKKICTLFKNHHGKVVDKKKRVLKNCSASGDFTIGHCNLSQTLKYNVKGWLKCCRELPTMRSSASLLSMCHNDDIQHILTSLSQKSQSDGLDIKYYSKRSVLAQTKLEMDCVISLLSQTEHLSFVYCVSPIPNAGLSRLKESISQSLFEENVAIGGFFSVPFVKTQLQTFHTLSILRSLKFGFPEYMDFKNFMNTVKNVIPEQELPDAAHLDKDVILKMLNYLKIKSNRYRIGKEQIFFQIGTVFDLENSKELSATVFIIKLQTICRRYLSVKKVEKMKMDSNATKIIQRNCLVYLRMKEWSWWKLYSQIKPLIPVFRTEEELKDVKHNSDILQNKCKQLEEEKSVFKLESRRLEELLDEMKNEQILQRQKFNQITEILQDKETNEILLKTKIEELHEKVEVSSEMVQSLQSELNSCRNNVASVIIEDDLSQKDLIKPEVVVLQHKSNEYLEELIRKTAEEKDAVEITLQQSRKLCERLKNELNDCKYEMDKSVTIDEMEEKQQSLEEEIKRLKYSLMKESLLYEDLQKICDIITAEKATLEVQNEELKKENEQNLIKMSSMNSVDYDATDFYDEREFSYRKRKIEFEQRIRELEEEVDEVNDNFQISLKEKFKQQIQIEKLTFEKNHIERERDEEIDNLKSSRARKVKNLELLMEEDNEKRRTLIKEKRENERIILDLKQQLEAQRDITVERKLKKELRLAREKLSEALDYIDDLKVKKEDKTELKDLKDQLDEMEHSRNVSLKQNLLKDRELEDCHAEIDNLNKAKADFEEKLKYNKAELFSSQNQNEDLEAEMSELSRKLKLVQNQNLKSMEENHNLKERINALEEERKNLLIKIDQLEQELMLMSFDQTDKSELLRLQNKVTDIEMKLRNEENIKSRLQSMNEKLKDQLSDAQSAKENFESKDQMEQDKNKKLQKQLKEARNNLENQSTEMNINSKKINSLNETIVNLEEEVENKNKEVFQLKQNVQRLERLLKDEDDDSDHSFSEVLNQADNLIKKRKFSMDHNVLSPRKDVSNRRNSVATERFSDTFDDFNEY